MDKNRKYHVKIVDTETGEVIVDERSGCFIGVFDTGDGVRAASVLFGTNKDVLHVVLSAEAALKEIKTAHPELALLLVAKDALGISMTTVDLTALEKIKSSGGAEPDVSPEE